ncbi:dephospho-CoA kinase [Thermomonospora curvata]|uniref:Dephospho-CoA kinase n=1 Tax=Thermomonospora curvata (strain ATCC 19995 / DSM 43183 / JCM 3096 / KCTC 9072 / NBRC 15933 / NCIMB 10081 / Henssen B9) TaxID=471852 RepID=D1A6Y8_THECD|nr:dephospho-CoA kinase [Thermomonospora curvata]ACY98392.1 dephospho-CoA kinase [Thermomonospora curvata DSM 43183]
MLRVGLTGGIGSGKSEVSARLAARGALIIDADKIAREVVAPGTPGLAAVVAEFGEEVLLPDGSMDREKVGSIVFADAERRAALNAIVHPLVGQRMEELVSAAPRDAIVVYDVPLLVENGLAEMYDVVVVVDVPVQTQIERLTTRRGMSESDARARIAAQASREQRLAVADHVIDNSGTLQELEERVEALWAELTERAAAS